MRRSLTAWINATLLGLPLLVLIQQTPQPIGVLRILQSEQIRLVLEVVEPVQFRASKAATRGALNDLAGLAGVNIAVDAVRGGAQWLRHSRGGGGDGRRDGHVAHAGLSGLGRRRCGGHGGLAVTVVAELSPLNGKRELARARQGRRRNRVLLESRQDAGPASLADHFEDVKSGRFRLY